MQLETEVRMTVRLPASAVEFLDSEAKKEFTSRNAQIVRSIRERMQQRGAEFGDQTPAASINQGSGSSSDEYAD